MTYIQVKMENVWDLEIVLNGSLYLLVFFLFKNNFRQYFPDNILEKKRRRKLRNVSIFWR